MSTLGMIFKETLHRKMNFILSVLAVVMAITMYVAFYTTGLASKRETIRLMRDIGYNLRIIPKLADMNKFWTDGYTEQTMPQEYVNRFAFQNALSYNHLLAVLHKKIIIQNMEILLTGISQEVTPPDKGGSPMIFSISDRSVYLGYEVAKFFGLQKDNDIIIMGKKMKVEKCLSESGSDDDIRIYGNLNDIQDLLGMQGRINEIKALECLCHDPSLDTRTVVREQLTELIPDAKVIQISSIANAREEQRLMMDKYFTYILVLVIVLCGALVGILSLMNVRERKSEIGILRALGYKSGKISILFLGKSIYVGAFGAFFGFVLGTIVALLFGKNLFPVTANSIQPIFDLLIISIIVAPVFTAISGFIPAMFAVAQEPADTLREE